MQSGLLMQSAGNRIKEAGEHFAPCSNSPPSSSFRNLPKLFFPASVQKENLQEIVKTIKLLPRSVRTNKLCKVFAGNKNQYFSSQLGKFKACWGELNNPHIFRCDELSCAEFCNTKQAKACLDVRLRLKRRKERKQSSRALFCSREEKEKRGSIFNRLELKILKEICEHKIILCVACKSGVLAKSNLNGWLLPCMLLYPHQIQNRNQDKNQTAVILACLLEEEEELVLESEQEVGRTQNSRKRH